MAPTAGSAPAPHAGPKAPANTAKYERDQGKFPKKVLKGKSRRITSGIKKVDQEYKEFVKAAAATDMLLQEEAGFLEAEGPMEKTARFRQDDIADAVDISTANKKFDLSLVELGPYTLDYSRNGRRLLLGGRKGHVASIDWRLGALDCELFLNETVHAVQYFHSHQYFAVAQKKYTFIYDQSGLELHRLKQHLEHTLLDFLPYHFLLVGAGHSASLKYHDVSTGVLVSELRTKLGPTQAMKQNPWNAVMHLGHGNGTVSMWCPTMNQPVVKVQTNRGPVRDLAVDREGRYMAVSGTDRKIKLWDLRKLQELDSYLSPTPANSLQYSDNGLLSVGWGPHVTVWKDTHKTHQNSPYMTHLLPGSKVEKVKYVPFEDVLGVGHSKGLSSLIIPGAGEANYDAMELNPYESSKQRQESEVRSLLNKLRPDTISLDPSFIGTVDKNARNVRLSKSDLEAAEQQEGNAQQAPGAAAALGRAPEQSKLKNYMRKKQTNIMDARKMRTERNLQMEEERKEKLRMKEMGVPDEKDSLGPALGRFA
ncbi:BING4CT-domain-containing protein [Metschnikowia bicuspidata var. bicuspidata NRRL YB-4993]|uniref:U three protein 7 n=1 Tax=Metschnikowia bicuspidata var. bicuspidata NRRL YB-4993 TaxID=869754 RepID=A0A1A0HBL5_9ASCO|nr:BING4CT-domain-containing protein [Metschnikowia bicuspidata var. bicuspidata NRRL YB-4993]OBA21278.1 BING4CT-domain-containing protein [Metschnikowia bicuspidata var. bicuspidata NRRL YB-4993]